MIRVLKSVAALLLLPLFLALLQLPSQASASNSSFYISYGVILDAGATGTTAYIYEWNTITNDRAFPAIFPAPVGLAPWTTKTTPGLQTVANVLNPNLDPFLRPLVEFAKLKVPKDSWPLAPLILRGTSALRKLPANTSAVIMNAARTYLGNATLNPFRYDTDYVGILSAEEEGILQWVTSNLVNQTLQANNSAATLELGSTSATLTFRPNETALSDYYDLRVSTLRLGMYTHSYIAMGIDDFFATFLNYLVPTIGPVANTTATAITHPCLPTWADNSYRFSTISGVSNLYYNGSGDVTRCYELIQSAILAQAPPTGCPILPCTALGVYQPPIDSSMPIRLMSRFTRIATALGCNGLNSIECLKTSIDTKCFLSKDDVATTFPTYTSGWDSAVNSSYRLCFDAVYAYALLKDGLGINRVVDFGVEVAAEENWNSWALGEMTEEVGLWQVRCEVMPTLPPAVTAYAVMCDAEIGGTHINIFEFQNQQTYINAMPTLSNQNLGPAAYNTTITPGLDAVLNNASLIAQHVKQIVAGIQYYIPNLATVVIYMRFSTDLHLLNPLALRQGRLDALAIFRNTSMTVRDDSAVDVLPAESGTTFRWMSVNLNESNLPFGNTTGIVEVGTHSIEVAFLPTEAPADGLSVLSIPETDFYLYTHSYPAFGIDSIYEAARQLLISDAGPVYSSGTVKINHPCYPQGYTSTQPVTQAVNATTNVTFMFSGTFAQSDKYVTCRALVRRALHINATTCITPPCGLAGTYQPPVPSAMKILLFFDSPIELPCLPSDNPQGCLYDLCRRIWAVGFDDFAHVSPVDLLHKYCFGGVYMYVLLNEGFSIAQMPSAPERTPINWAWGALTYEIGTWDNRPKDCHLGFQQAGIADDAPLLVSDWFRIVESASPLESYLPTGQFRTMLAMLNTEVPIALDGFRVVEAAVRNSDLMIKLSQRPSDCLGGAPGTSELGRRVDAVNRVGYIGPVNQIGSYHLCFRHRQLWEQSGIVVTVEEQNRDDRLYYGAQTCKAIMEKLNDSYCGCYFEVLDADSASSPATPSTLHYTISTDTPAFILRRTTIPHIVNQGCCASNTPIRQRFLLSAQQQNYDGRSYPAIWGLCKFPNAVPLT